MKNKGTNYASTLAVIALIVVFLLLCKYQGKFLEGRQKEEDKIYKDMSNSYSMEIKGKIINTKNSDGYAGMSLLYLSNGEKMSISGGTYNYEYGIDLANLLRINDSIYKSKNNDSIFVYRGKEEYIFMLNKTINEK